MLRTIGPKKLRTGTLRGVPVFLLGLVGVLGSASLVGCDRITPIPAAPTGFVAPAPGRDEIYVAGPYRLTMSAYEGLRREFPGLAPTDLAQFALATQWFADAEKVALKDAAQCMRALFLPKLDPEALARIEARLTSSFRIESLDALRERWKKFLPQSAIEWNLPLAKDYGINPDSLGRNSR